MARSMLTTFVFSAIVGGERRVDLSTRSQDPTTFRKSSCTAGVGAVAVGVSEQRSPAEPAYLTRSNGPGRIIGPPPVKARLGSRTRPAGR